MRRYILAISAAALMVAFGSAAAAAAGAGAEPGCVSESVRIQGDAVPAPAGVPCDSDTEDDDGLLPGLPVPGLPGVGGVL